MSSRNAIYRNDDTYPLTNIVGLPYTDVIVGFIVPDDNYNLYKDADGFYDGYASDIQALQNDGKNVLISFGGSTVPSSAYQYYAQSDLGGLVQQIVSVVTTYGFNGVDIDYEDDSGFDQPGQPASYDGAGFLVALTNQLYQMLPAGQNIITHAPATPFWDSQGGYYAANTQTPAYTQIWQQAGNQIAWFNNQFYNNNVDDAASKVAEYQAIAGITGPQNQLLGALVGNPADYRDDTDTGYITLDDMTNNVIAPLKARYGSQFGGVMGWEFSQDGPPTYDQGGAWANGIGNAVGAGDLFVFYQGKGNSGGLWYTVSGDSINWNQHAPVPNLSMSDSPSAVLWQGGIEVFFQGANNDGQLWRTFSSDGNAWGTTQTNVRVQGVGMSGSPSAVVYNGSLYVFYQGLNNSGGLWYTVSGDSINWTQHAPVPNLGMSGSPSAAVWKGGITVFHQGSGNGGQLWYTYSGDGNNWGNPKTDSIVPVSGLQMSGSPSVVEYNGRLYTFFQGGNQYQGQLWYVTYDGTNWAEYKIQNLGMSGSPCAALWQGGNEVFFQGANNDGQLWRTFSSDGNSWGTTQTNVQVMGVGMSGSPSCVVY
jgi:chitinase